MHELSIAMSLLELAAEAVEEAGEAGLIEAVRVRVGDLSGVVPEALEFAWDSVIEGTAFASARLVIDRAPARVRCPTCNATTELEFPPIFVCSRCGRPAGNVIEGKELDLMSIELRGETAQAPDQETTHATPNP